MDQADVDQCQSDMSLDEEEDDRNNILVNLERPNENSVTLSNKDEQTAKTVAGRHVTNVSLFSSRTQNTSDNTLVKRDYKCSNSKTVTDCSVEKPTDLRSVHYPTIKSSTCNINSSSTLNREVKHPLYKTIYPELFSKTLSSTQQQPLAGPVQPTCFKKQQDKKAQPGIEENAQIPYVIKSMEGLILTQEVIKESKNESCSSFTMHSGSDSTHKQTDRPCKTYKNFKNQSSNRSPQDLRAPQGDLYNSRDVCGTSKGKFTSSGFKPVQDNELNNKVPKEMSDVPSEVSVTSTQEILEKFILAAAKKIVHAAEHASKMKEQFKETHQKSPQDGGPVPLGSLSDVQSSSRSKSKILTDVVTADQEPQPPEVNTSKACMSRLCPTDQGQPPIHQQKEPATPRLDDLMAIEKRRKLAQQETEELNKLITFGKILLAQKKPGELNTNVVNVKPKINKTDCFVKWKLHKITLVDKANAYKPNPDMVISCSYDPSRDPRLRPQGPSEARPKIKVCDKKPPRLIPLEPINTGALLSPEPHSGIEENT